MAIYKMNHLRPIKIIGFYAFFMAISLLLCIWIVGNKPILSHASKSKPYAVLLQQRFYTPSLWQKKTTTIICFGDSNCTKLWSLFRRSVKKQDLQEEVRIGDWAYPGTDMYDYYCLLHRANKFSPDLVIIPINWRAFGRAWGVQKLRFPELSAFVPLREQFLPEYENPLESLHISPSEHLKNKLLLFQVYPLGIKMWARDSLRGAFPELGRSEEERIVAGVRSLRYRKQARAFNRNPDHYKTRFPMKLTYENPMLRAFRSLANSASRHETEILFFVWPLDQELFAELGILDKDGIEQSRQILLEASKANTAGNIYFLDLTDFLEHKYFKDSGGHCTIAGRRKIAEAIARKAYEILHQGSERLDGASPALANRPANRLNENL